MNIVWQDHPLRTLKSDQLLETIILEVEEGEFFHLITDEHPKYRLVCAVDYPHPHVKTPLESAITHELTHLIDRFDSQFIETRSPEGARQTINDLPEGNANESIRRAFFTYWNAYIDGRLERRGIVVDSLASRMEEKLASRGQHGPVSPEEPESVEKIWNTEPHTLDELITFAQRFPYRRAARYWIDYPDDSA